ncbi:hypothetical protein GOV14_02865 [Candidatus Pacearchaeota archaeon]|nr:hypothetical protein [Candidatus Pacearchaeota archaeon]
MIILEGTVNFVKQRLIIDKIWKKYGANDLLLEDKMDYYEALANLHAWKYDNSGLTDYKSCMRAVNAVEEYMKLEELSKLVKL